MRSPCAPHARALLKVLSVWRARQKARDDEIAKNGSAAAGAIFRGRHGAQTGLLLSKTLSPPERGGGMSSVLRHPYSTLYYVARVSIGTGTGPPIGMQRGPLSLRLVPVVHRGDPRDAECPSNG